MSGLAAGSEQKAGKVGRDDSRVQTVRDAFELYPDFPKPGIQFMDIFGVFKTPRALEALISLAVELALSHKDEIDVVVGLDARGFLLAPLMANALSKPFVPARKKGKLPGACFSVEYALEYGTAQMEIQKDSVKPDDRVLIVDDLLATGGTLSAAVDLVGKAGAKVALCWVVVELTELAGRTRVAGQVEALLEM